jgi:ATP-binding cassette subfamily B (MDR/TAP) protein 1
LVGPSGCGKTSIVSLLERFYDAQKGKILCNGTNIADIDTKEYRKAISLVAQEPTLYQGTVKENILLGVTETTTEEAIHQACLEAEIHDFITSLPDGYNTDVGTKGINLSGGQKQRIAIARALIRDPKILLLDEATSSLDSESEKLVQKAFEKAGKKGRTMVVVAHRLATIQNADVIFVLGDGKVLEKGDHNALLRQKGVYYQMVSCLLTICQIRFPSIQPSLTCYTVSITGARSIGTAGGSSTDILSTNIFGTRERFLDRCTEPGSLGRS